jgi:5-methylcytosine-specific restriction enzyme B
MRRPLDRDGKGAYTLHRQWLTEVLGAGDSILTPGRSIWSPEHLDELDRYFIERPDKSKDKRFLEKLQEQLGDASPDAIQLMAEIHVVHFLIIWTGAISASKKRADVEAILSWMPTPVALPDDIAAAFGPGFVHPGQWVITRRDTQLVWLVRFAQAWQRETTERQQQIADDPWEAKLFAEGVVTPQSDASRLAFLHLAHPETFEAIVSPDHKHRIVERFAEVAGHDPDVDRQLLEARIRLSLRFGDRFDWYGDPVVRMWLKNRVWKTFMGRLQPFRALPDFDAAERDYKVNLAGRLAGVRDQVLSGEPGWLDQLRAIFHSSANNLTSRYNHEPFLDWLRDNPDEGRDALCALWATGPSREECLDAFLALVPAAGLGPLGERLNVATFLLMADYVTNSPPMMVSSLRRGWELAGWGRDGNDLTVRDVRERAIVFLDEIVRDSRQWAVPLRDRLDAQGALWALTKYDKEPDGWTGGDWGEFLEWRSTVPDDESIGDDSPDATDDGTEPPPDPFDHIAAAAEELFVDRAVLDEIVTLLADKGQVVLYGPPGTGKTYLAVRLAEAIAGGDPTRVSVVQFHPATSYEDFFEGLRPRVTDAGQVTYERTNGPLVNIVERAEADTQRSYVLVVDEINRANLPKVFGELLFLLEYRDRKANTLYRPTEPFGLPRNLWIIGTMNTADRSVALVDAAMRRRFHFVPFFPHDGPMKGLLRRWLTAKGGRVGVADFLDEVNKELVGAVGAHLLIGPSHFMKADLSAKALERIWTYNIFPVIEEYLWHDRDSVARWRWPVVERRFSLELTGRAAPDEEVFAPEPELVPEPVVGDRLTGTTGDALG